MKRQVIASGIPPHWWERLKGAQFGFIAGILIGLVMGWFFHGVISLAIRFGLVVLLLLPLIVIGWLWFRSQRSQPPGPAGPRQGMDSTWQGVIDVQRVESPQPQREDPSTLVDVPFARPRSQPRPDDIEAELERLKQQRERDN